MDSLRVTTVVLIATTLLAGVSVPLAQAREGRPAEPLPLAFADRESVPAPASPVEVGCSPILGVNPDPVDFGAVLVGQISELTVTLRDDSGEPPPCGITISGIQLTLGSINFQLDGLPDSFPVVIASGESLTFTARFSPSQSGDLMGIMTIESNDATSPTREITLRGVGLMNEPPDCDPGGPYAGTPALPVTFDGSGSSDPDGTIASYAWDFGDGNTGTGSNPTHTYAGAGEFTVSLTVTDDGNATSSCSTTATISAGNEPPTCNAGGSYAGTIGEPVQFNGTASTDSDGGIISYAWDFGDGNLGKGPKPSHAYTSAGEFTVSLTVTDDDGAPSTCTAPVTIGSAASITVLDPNGGEELPPGVVATILWSSKGKVGPVDVELSTDGGANFFIIGPNEPNDGSFDWTVMHFPTTQALVRVSEAADGVPADQSDAFFTINGVEVTRPNGGENFLIGAAEAITWDTFGTLIDSVTVEYSVNSGVDWLPIATAIPHTGSFDWTVPGPPAQALVRVFDISNLLALDISDAAFNILEQGQNLPPACDAGGPYTGTAGQPVAIDGTGSSDADGQIVLYAWDFGDGNSGEGPNPGHTYAGAGEFTVSLTVTDNDGAPSSCSTTATIEEVPVAPNCMAGGPYTGAPGVPVSFDGTGSSDPDGKIVNYAWDFGDGNTGEGSNPSHAYAGAGDFTVSLTVTDDDSLTSACSATATIVEGNLPPICDADGPYGGVVGIPVVFDGTGSSDPDGKIIAYNWDFGDGNSGTGDSPTHTYSAPGPYTVSLTVTDSHKPENQSTCSTTATIETPSGELVVAVPPRVFAAPEADVPVPVLVLSDVTGLGILSAEISIAYDPRVLTAKGVSLAGTIGQGGTFEWDVEEVSDSEEIVRMSIAWVSAIAGCDELAFINFHSTRRLDHDNSVLDLEIVFNEGLPAAVAVDGEFVKGVAADVNCSSNVSPGDASLVLQHTVGTIDLGDPRYPCLTPEIADVSGNDDITAFDASLILRFVLGLIAGFPNGEGLGCESGAGALALAAAWGGDAGIGAGAARAVMLEASPPLAGGVIDVALSIDDLSRVAGGDFTLRFDPAALEVVEVAPLISGQALAESRVGEGAVHLAVAFAALGEPGPMALARVRFAPVPGFAVTGGETELVLARADLNEGAIPSAPVGTTVSLTATGNGVVQARVPERVFAGHDTDVLIPVFLENDVSGLGILSAEITLGYDPQVLRATGVGLAGTIGEGGSFEFNVEEVDGDRDEAHVSIVWPTPRAGCGTLANLVFRASSATEFQGSPLDLEISFNEGTPAAQPTDGLFLRGVLGDVNRSRNLSSLDASLILNEVVGSIDIPDFRYPNLVLDIADVSGNLEIRAFDAALVLQRVLGIIDRFPAEGAPLECSARMLAGEPLAAPGVPEEPRRLHLVWLAEEDGLIEAALVLDDGGSVAAAEAALTFDPALLEVVEVAAGVADGTSIVAGRTAGGRLNVAAVLAHPASGETRLAVVRFARVAPGEARVAIENPNLNEGRVPVEAEGARLDGAPVVSAVHLAQNRPNPFNPQTTIAFATPVQGRVELAVYSLTGRLVRSLVADDLAPGEHLVPWDGRDDQGHALAGGVYVVRLTTAGVSTTRKATLIR